MKKFIAAAFLGLGLTLIAVSPAIAANGNPHQEESDGCDHGNTGKDCKPDPSENGKDCDVHGNHGGVNEDHCDTADEPTTATTAAPAVEETTTTTAQPEVTTTTQPEPEPTLVVVNDPLVENNDAQAADQNDAVAQPILTTEVEAVSLTAPAPAPAALSVPAPAQELPHTGASSLVLLTFGLGLAFTGLGFKTLALAYTL